jgi:ClpP class serine protease
LAADAVIMDENAVLGPVDPLLGEYPAEVLSTSQFLIVKEKNQRRFDGLTNDVHDIFD